MSEQVDVVFEEVIDTHFGEKVTIESEFKVKNFINALPWRESDDYQEDRLDEGQQRPDFTFPEGFAAHQKWHSDEEVWSVDIGTVPVLTEYFEQAGFTVDSNVKVRANETLA